MSKSKILVVDDEENILALLQYNLSKEGYDITCVQSGEEALEQAKKTVPDLIILDLMLPGMDGIEVCKTLKKDTLTQDIPIIMLTAKGEETDIVKGLKQGVEDYISKPFSIKVLIARIQKTLQRNTKDSAPSARPIAIRNLLIRPSRHEVLVNGKSVRLTPAEFRMLHVLASRPGSVLTRSEISSATHGADLVVSSRTIDVQMVRLRKKLGSMGEYLQTVHGVGYFFKE